MTVEKDWIISKIKDQNNTVTVKISKSKTNDPLFKNYNITQFLDPAKFSFPKNIEELIPRNVPLYVDTEQHYFDRVARALAVFKQCALVGPTGTGKTHLVCLIAQLAGLPLWEVNCNQETSTLDLFGRYDGHQKEDWVDGVISSWCRHGGILSLDEVNMMKSDVAARLNPILDQRGHLVLTEKNNEIISRHNNAFLIMTMNPVSAEFAGTKPLNAGMKRRIGVWINFDYLSVGSKIDSKEIDLIVKLTGIDTEVSKQMVIIGATLRDLYYSRVIPYAPSVGDLTNWARLMVYGATFEEGAEETIVALAGDNIEDQKTVREVVRLAVKSSSLVELKNSIPSSVQMEVLKIDEAEQLIAQGWQHVGTLPNGKVILQSSR